MTEWLARSDMLAIPAEEHSEPDQLPAVPTVSVLMMTRNHAPFLRQAVESVVRQACDFSIELLIGEDFSTDETRRVALALQQTHPGLVRVFVADRNVGITANFLRLVAHARGKYLAFLEGDDYWTCDHKLRRQVDLMEGHPEYAWCAARTSNRMTWVPAKAAYGLDEVLRRYLVHTSTVLFRATYLERYPMFPDRVCWESMLLGYLTERGLCGFLDEEFSYYRRHEGGLWHNAERMNRVQMSRDCIDALDGYFGGRHASALADREIWIYRMDIAAQWGPGFLEHWRQSFGVLWSAGPRLLARAPVSYLLLWGQWLTMPIVAIYRAGRGRLALRRRFESVRRAIGL
ncbi:MAG: glycosyltransferase [Chromatiaceae bacterium]